MPGKGRRILVVEDELLVQQLLKAELSSLNFVVQTASSVIEAKRVIASFDPDIALIDISLKGGLSGLHLGHILIESHPDIAQVYLTRHDDIRTASTDSLDFPPGVGFLSKHQIDSSDELVAEIDRVVAGIQTAVEDPSDHRDSIENLGPKGRRVLDLLAEGYSNHYIAETTGIATKTVEYHIDAIYRALGVSHSPDRNSRVDVALRYQRAMFTQELDKLSADIDPDQPDA